MTDQDPSPLPETELDGLLAHASTQPHSILPDGLRSRLLADALEHLPPPARTTAPRPGPGRFAQLWQSLGGAPGFAGLTAAGLAGIWIGAAPPAPVADLHVALFEGAALIRSDVAPWDDVAHIGFGDDMLLALLDRD